jgi:hypothetical protein
MKFQPASFGAPPPAADPREIAELIAYSDQLAGILRRETAAMKAGEKDALKKWEADKARTMALYQRDLNALKKDPAWAKKLPPATRERLTAAGERLNAALKEQSQLIARRRHVTEGIVQAIAKDVSQKRQGVSPYARPLPGKVQPPPSIRAVTAITLNSVV